MKMESAKNNVSSNVSEVRQFTIAGTDNIFQTLSSRLYTNPIRAIIRETVSNAIDANIEGGVHEQILLHLPTKIEPEFFVEDHGIGMDEDTVYNVYTQYGNSTKSGSNNCIGGLGLGSKTPFSYTSQFTIESSKNGLKNTYTAFLNEDGIPTIAKLDSVECDQPGTKVSFPVELSDIYSFYTEAISTLLFTMDMPKIVGDPSEFWRRAGVANEEEYIALREEIKNNHGLNNEKIESILSGSSYNSLIVEMGGVAYNVDTAEVLDGHNSRWDGILGFLLSRYENVILHMNIGDVAIQSSREALQYTERTKKALNSALVNMVVLEATKANEAA